MMRVKVAEWLLTLLGIATLTRLTMGTELHHATVCYRTVLSEPPRCEEGSNIYVISVSYHTNNTCPEESSCGHPAVNRTLYDVILSQCDGATECLTNTTETFWDSVICPPGNWVDVLYTCQTNTSSTTAQTSPATQTMLSAEIWIGILVAALSVTAVITLIAVLCVRRRRKKDSGETVGESGTPRGGSTTCPHPGSSGLLNPNYEQSDAIIPGSRPDRQGAYDRPKDPYTVVRRPDSAHDGNMGENSNIPGSHTDRQVAFHRPKDPYTVVRRPDSPYDLNMQENSVYN